MYFPNVPANEADPVLELVPTGRRATPVARRDGADGASLIWNVLLQGTEETVFFGYWLRSFCATKGPAKVPHSSSKNKKRLEPVAATA